MKFHEPTVVSNSIYSDLNWTLNPISHDIFERIEYLENSATFRQNMYCFIVATKGAITVDPILITWTLVTLRILKKDVNISRKPYEIQEKILQTI